MKYFCFIIAFTLNVCLFASIGVAFGAVIAAGIIKGGLYIAASIIASALFIVLTVKFYGNIKEYFKKLFAVIR